MTYTDPEIAPGIEHFNGDRELVVDSMDEMQPVPRAGKFFAEEFIRGEIITADGVIIPEEEERDEFDIKPIRARVAQLGPPREGEAWDFEAGWDVILPYHAGYRFSWLNQSGVEESVWIVDANEVIAVFRPR